MAYQWRQRKEELLLAWRGAVCAVKPYCVFSVREEGAGVPLPATPYYITT